MPSRYIRKTRLFGTDIRPCLRTDVAISINSCARVWLEPARAGHGSIRGMSRFETILRSTTRPGGAATPGGWDETYMASVSLPIHLNNCIFPCVRWEIGATAVNAEGAYASCAESGGCGSS